MKVKKTILFEQSATPEWHYEPGEDGKPEMVMNVISNGFELSYNDNHAYVLLYKMEGDTILLRKAKARGVMVFEKKELMESTNDYDNIRTAIKKFDALLETWKNEWGEAERTYTRDYGF